MTEKTQNHDERPEPQAPAELVRALRAIHAPGESVPTKVDERILSSARRQLASGRRRFNWRFATIGALAAAVAIVFILPEFVTHTPPPRVMPVLSNDIDGNGRIDILDAFALARHIERREETAAGWDVNADGQIDRRDVDALAKIAVRLNGGSTS